MTNVCFHGTELEDEYTHNLVANFVPSFPSLGSKHHVYKNVANIAFSLKNTRN